MTKNIKVLATIFLGLVAIPSSFASDSERDQENNQLGSFFYPAIYRTALAEPILPRYNLIGPYQFLERDLDLLIISFSGDSACVKEEKMRAEKKDCLPFVTTDILAHILKFLPPAKYEEVGAVCKRFYRITRSRTLLPLHLNSNILPDSFLSLSINTLTDLGAILTDTIGNNDERALRMEAFEQNHLVEITTAFRVLKFYHRVLELRSLCPGDRRVKYILEPYLNSKLNSNKFPSQHILGSYGSLIEQIGELVNKDYFPLLTVRPYLQNCVALLSPLLAGTQTGFTFEGLVAPAALFGAVPIPPVAFFIHLPIAAPIVPPVVAPVVAPAENDDDADDDQEEEE